MKWKFSPFVLAGVGLLIPSAIRAQGVNTEFLSDSLAREIERLQALLGGPCKSIVTMQVGAMENGGNCTIKITVRDACDSSRFYTHTVPLVVDCKEPFEPRQLFGYRLPGAFRDILKRTIGEKDIGSANEDDLMRAYRFFFADTRNSVQDPAPKPQLAQRRATPTVPVVLDLPLAPPLLQGADVYNSNGCDSGADVRLFRVNEGTSTVTRLDGCNWRITATIPVGTRAQQAELTPDGKTLVVTSLDGAVTFIDTGSNRVIGTLRTPEFFPAGIAITHDGRVAYVTSFTHLSPAILIVDIANRSILGRILVAQAYPDSVFLNPEGTMAYVLFPVTDVVYMIDTLTSTVSGTLSISAPMGMTFDRTGSRAYISSSLVGTSNGVIRVVDTASFRVIDSIPLTGTPSNVVMTADGRHLVVENYLSPTFWTIELSTKRVRTDNTGVRSPGLTVLQ